MSSKKSILYYPNYLTYARDFQPVDIPIKGVTDVVYAFFNLSDPGNGNYIIQSSDTYVQLKMSLNHQICRFSKEF